MRERRANGRKGVVDLIDAVLSNHENMQLLKRVMQDEFEVNPLAFVDRYAVPLTPKEMLLPDGVESDLERAARIRASLPLIDAATAGLGEENSKPTLEFNVDLGPEQDSQEDA